ncbi:MAG: 5-formyltetrahydrofolate cyclo-ligase [Lachnospiraceae bacterium]|nr:5-formyltetrahydrofolate cyclo-ligase [Lachnospiraceae bacterium]
MAIAMNKQMLRKEYLKRRDHQTETERKERSAAIAKAVFSIELVVQAEDLLLYADFGSEVQTEQIFNTARRMRKRIYYPKVEGNELSFYRVEDLSELRVGFKGIQEPFMLRHTGGDWIYAAVAIVPATVLGRDGYRLGYGRGFYDRFLSRYPSIFKLGIGYQVQLAEKVPHDSRDVRLNGIITEEEQLFFQKN